MLSRIIFLLIIVPTFHGKFHVEFQATAIPDLSGRWSNRRCWKDDSRYVASRRLPPPAAAAAAAASIISAYQKSSSFHVARCRQRPSLPVMPISRSTPAVVFEPVMAVRGGDSTVAISPATPEDFALAYNASNTDAGTLTMDELWQQIRTSPLGLSNVEAERRLKQYGVNSLQKPRAKSLLILILEQFQDRLVQILLIVAIVSAVFSVAEVASFSGDASPHAIWKSFVEPIVIVTILVLNAVVSVWQSRSASDSLAALEQMQAAMCTVLRHDDSSPPTASQSFVTAATDLVPGDVIELRTGDKIPADGRLISLTSSVLTVDEGPLTGESVAVFKLPGNEGAVTGNATTISEQCGMLFAGTCVTQGSGRVLVTQTGMDTQFGRIQRGVLSAKAEQPKTPLQVKLDDFGDTLTGIIFVICLLVWIVSIPKMNDPSFSSIWDGAIYYAKVSVALGVAAIPEGLPAVITLCLSLGTRRMAQRNVIVRNLPSVETLGCTSVICTDKTGTLTTNEMTVVSLVVLEKANNGVANVTEHTVDGYSYSPLGNISDIESDVEVKVRPFGAIADVAAVSSLCNDAIIIGNDYSRDQIEGTSTAESSKKGSGNDLASERKTYERIGEPTEAALCVLAEKLGGMSNLFDNGQSLHTDIFPSVLASLNVKSWRELHPRVATLEFNRDRKSMSVLCNYQTKLKSRQNGNRLLVKGAPNLLIERCTHVKYREGNVVRLNGRLRRDIMSKVDAMASRPLRCIALAVKDSSDLDKSLKQFAPNDARDIARHPLLKDASTYSNIESGLTLVGIVGIKDPARPGVAHSIDMCSKAGIRVMMITGDAKDTAVAIARDVHIFPPDTEVSENVDPVVKAFEGRDFFSKPVEEQMQILAKGNIVFCRTEPSDKQKLVKMLQSLGEVTCMTGDGVNDAPALQQASIGVAMGITGTEVSKEAADMILSDDDFSTIVAAVEEGRRIYNNMQAFICFLISCNIGEICAIFFATLAGFPEPLTAMHLLWVNLVTDGPPATALGFNPPAPDLMDAPPRPNNEPIMTRWMLMRYCITGLYVGMATIGVFVQCYLAQGITISQLANWSQCGSSWTPHDGAISCNDLFQGVGRMMPQTMALTTLVCMEMLKALSAVSVDTSIMRIGPQDNKWLLLGVSCPMLLHIFFLYSSKIGLGGLGESFGMVPLSKSDWMTVVVWAGPILIVEEILKYVGRVLNLGKGNLRKVMSK